MAELARGSSGTSKSGGLIRAEQLEHQILVLRGQKVMLDSDLAAAYGVAVKRLNEAVRRNAGRFPPDFMFQLSKQEYDNLKSQFATSRSWGGRRTAPNAFTEHGAVMLAAVLNNPVAVEASIQVVRAFVRLRQLIQSNEKLRRKLARIETKLHDHDERFAVVFDAIRQLMDDEDDDDRSRRKRIGFESEATPG